MGTAVSRFDEKARAVFDRIGTNDVRRGELLRHPVYTRFLHWSYALCFFLALFSGFGIYMPWLFRWFTPIFGGGQLSRSMHPWFGIAFCFFFGLQTLNWTRDMIWTKADTKWVKNIRAVVSNSEKLEPPETGFFNGGQKVQFWEIVGGSIVFLITGVILWFGARTFGRTAVWISYILHDISALIMLGGIFIHIYLSTIGEPGTFGAMIRGAVSEAWAWTFHPAWYRQVTGRDPRQAYEEAARKAESPSR
jgi:formate dehydrogenase subunit gamma